MAEVEPRLHERPRVHRFAQVPVVGERDTESAAVGVVIDTAGGGDAAATRASLLDQPRAPAAVETGDARTALGALRTPWAAIVTAGDRLADGALLRLGQAATLAPDAAVVTCDDDVLDRAGRRTAPRCFPGPSPDLLQERDVTGAVQLVATSHLPARPPEGATWRYELARRLAGPDGTGHAHLPQILCHRAAGGGWAPAPARFGIVPVPSGEPTVEAIVCFRDRPELLARCARSLLDRTAYERLTLRLVDNGSQEVATADALDRLQRDARVTVHRQEGPFNFAALNNLAAAASAADVLAFVNNDVEISHGGWLDPLLAHATREEVGAVGPLLLYPDGRVQSAGAVVGLHGWAGHPFAGLRPKSETPFGAARECVRNWLAVTAACLVVERRKFAAVDGFDESFAVGGNDVDLGLRLTARGWRSLMVPSATVVHAESASRDPAAVPPGDFEASARAYGEFRTVGDPFYNPNLTLSRTDCSVRAPGE